LARVSLVWLCEFGPADGSDALDAKSKMGLLNSMLSWNLFQLKLSFQLT